MDDAPYQAYPPPFAIATTETQSARARLPFSFSGSGEEYFGIWLSNVLLSLYTLGGYCAWAKVRRLQYFYGNTWLDNANFAFQGNPRAIFLGRFVVTAILLCLYIASKFSMLFLLAGLSVFAMILPWLLRTGLVFRASYSSHRGLRFRFTGGNAQAYQTLMGWSFASVASLGLAAPAAAQKFRLFHLNHLHFGATPLQCNVSVSQCYRVWLQVGLGWLACALPLGALAWAGAHTWLRAEAMVPALALAALLAFWLTRAHYRAAMQNLFWNNISLGPHRFQSRLQAWPLFRLWLKNTLLTVFTLGLYRPFAVIADLRFRLAALSLIPGDSLQHLRAAPANAGAAIGAETADIFQLEPGL
jgi:uncharacterized membrane protein YjgN (DUF898 family)